MISYISYSELIFFRAYAKALHYKEEEFLMDKANNDHVIESLISINNKLQQKEAAEGLLQYVMRQREDQVNFITVFCPSIVT